MDDFITRLDFIFDQVQKSFPRHSLAVLIFFFIQNYFDVTDEPSEQIPFMYHYANRPGLSTQRSRQVIAQSFNTSVNGLPGNDGQL